MLSKVQQWGNSQGIRIPKSLLHDSQIKVGPKKWLYLFKKGK